MSESIGLLALDVLWPLALLLAWAGGELAYRWIGLPRISSYAIAGFLLAQTQLGFLPNPADGPISSLADFAFALILFELGYRINLRWLRANPWLVVSGVFESVVTFAAVFVVARLFNLELAPALLLATLAMATSPAVVVRVANELGGSGQVTERSLHLTALSCLLTVVAFKAIAGYWAFAGTGSFLQAIWSSVVVVLISAGIGTLFGVLVAALLRLTDNSGSAATVVFALAVLLLTTLTTALNFSPLLAAIAFGLVARHRRVVLTQAQRNFGVLGDLLTVLLFVFVAATLDWREVAAGLELALAIIAVRFLSKTAVTTAFARPSGITYRKGFLTGVALMPQSVFVILLIEQSRHLDIGWIGQVAGLAALVLMLEIAGPLATRWALLRAGEAHPERRSNRDAN